MSRRLVAFLAALVFPVVLAYGFFELGRSLLAPALRMDDPQILAFVPWCVPLAILCSWVASRGPKGAHAWSGLLGAVVGGIVGFVYFWALLISTNGMFLGFPFSVLAAWTIGASLALLLAWTPRMPAAWALDALAVVAIGGLVGWQLSIELRPKHVLTVLYRPGTSPEQRATETDQLFMVDTVRGKDFAPGVFLIGDASAGPEGVHFQRVEGVDTAGVSVVFAPHSSSAQRADVVRAALESPIVARVAWAPPGDYEKAEARRLAIDDAMRGHGRVTGNR